MRRRDRQPHGQSTHGVTLARALATLILVIGAPTEPIPAAPVDTRSAGGCFALSTAHTGDGTDPAPDPDASPGCPPGGFVAGEAIVLTAVPDPGWGVTGWSGTDEDAIESTRAELTMPAANHSVRVDYIDGVCQPLDLLATGPGAPPLPTPLGRRDWSDELIVSTDTASLVAADLDGDGDDDLAVGFSTLDWYENTGVPGLWPATEIGDPSSGAPVVLNAGDVDGDGDVDLAAVTRDELLLFENTSGDGSTWIEREILRENSASWESVTLADVDRDGDLDLLTASLGDDLVELWENSSGDATTWWRHVLVKEYDGAAASTLADLDGDGDLDALAGARFEDHLLWWQNDGSRPSDWVAHSIEPGPSSIQSVAAADLDGDADVDFVAPSADGLLWWENLDGFAGQWQPPRDRARRVRPGAGDLRPRPRRRLRRRRIQRRRHSVVGEPRRAG